MYDNGKYMVPGEMCAMIEKSNLAFPALRLLHGLYHQIAMQAGGVPQQIGMHSMSPSIVRVAELYRTVGPRGARDTRITRQAIEGLSGSRLFKECALSTNGRAIVYQFSSVAGQACFDKKSYGLLETDLIAACRSASDILFYSAAAKCARQNFPYFDFPGIGDGPDGGQWSRSREKWLASAEKMSLLLDHTYVIAASTSVLSLSIDRVRVKISLPTAQWTPAALYKAPIGASIYEVTGGKAARLSPDEIRRRSEAN